MLTTFGNLIKGREGKHLAMPILLNAIRKCFLFFLVVPELLEFKRRQPKAISADPDEGDIKSNRSTADRLIHWGPGFGR